MAERGLVVSVDDDRRAGERAAGNIVQRMARRALGVREQQKSVGIPTDSVSAGWQSYGPGGGPFYRAGPRRLAQLATAYGGTNDSVTWVFACVARIASEGASYPYRFEDVMNKEVADPPPELAKLMLKPNQKMTYFDCAEAILTDLELLGNSYWLKDQRNGYGQPLELLRLVPEAVKIAVTYDGRERGYVYEAPGGQMIPYELDEIIHFKYPNPLDEHYGMGTVEAIARALDQEIAQSLHVTGFFQNGARISGILTVPDVLTETAFQRVKNQFMEEFAGAASSFKVLVAEGGKGGAGPDFKPITQSPNTLGVVDLRKLSKDEILSGFGVPEFLLGGAAQAGVYKMDEAQNIFMRGMNPRITRYSERTTTDLISLWGPLKLAIKPHANEPLSIKLGNAEAALKGGATIDESREIAGFPRLDTPATRVPLVVNTLITIDQLYKRPAEAMPVPTPSAGVPPPEQAALPSGDSETEDPEQVAESTEEEEPATASGAGPKAGKASKAWRAPALPQGWEEVKRAKDSKLPQSTFEAVAEHHASVLVTATPIVRSGMVLFFTGQRKRVTDRLSEYGPSTRRARGGRLKALPSHTKAALEADGLWDTAAENAALQETYLPLIDKVGQLTTADLPGVEGGVAWDARHPQIDKARSKLAEKVTRVNDTTRAQIADTVDQGLKRGYSVVQIANGVSAENYGGVLGVFDSAVHDRAEMIARTETALTYNAAAVAGYQDAGVEKVEVMDGEDDEECAAANGQTWTIDEAEADELAHPNCIRAFAPLVEAESEATGGGDGGDGGGGEGAAEGEAATAAEEPPPPDEPVEPTLAERVASIDAATVTPEQLIDVGKEIGGKVNESVDVLRTKHRKAQERSDRLAETASQKFREYMRVLERRVDGPNATEEQIAAARDASDAAGEAAERARRRTHKAFEAIDTGRRDALKAALEEVRPMGGDFNYGRITKTNAKQVDKQAAYLPRAWITTANEHGQLDGVVEVLKVNAKGQLELPRAFYSPSPKYRDGSYEPGKGAIHASKATWKDEPDVVLHEATHRMEDTVPHLKQAADDYWRKRTGTEASVKLRDLTGNRSYRDDEIAKPDGFTSPYFGKTYRNEVLVDEETGRTYYTPRSGEVAGEMITMGQQALWYDKWQTWAKDPELIHWMIGVLAVIG